jgi:hypothetical protein
MQLTKEQERIRGIVERAHNLLAGALDQMYDVFDGESTTIRNMEATAASCIDVQSHFVEDAEAHNDAVESDRIDAAELQKKAEEDAAVDTLLRDGEASFDDKGKQIDTPVRNAAGETIKDVLARNKNVVEPPEPWPEPKVDDDGPKRDRLSDFGEGSDQ